MNLKQKLKEEKNVILIREIEYNQKNYVMTIKTLNFGIEYIYYEIENENIKDVVDKDILNYFKERYEIHEDVVY